jgi:hypothetical protein
MPPVVHDGSRSALLERLVLDIPKGGTADCDEANIDPDMPSQTKEKMKDMLSRSDRRH